MTMQSRRLERNPVWRRIDSAALMRCPVAVLLLVPTLNAWAQESGGAPALLIQPRLSLTQTLTDNLRLTSQGKDAALITNIAPGISLVRNTGRIKGSLDYALNSLTYTKSSEASQLQNALAAKLTAEAVEDWLFVDMQASVSQQAISAFGQQAADPSLANGNQSEVASLAVSPYVKGQLAGLVGYDLRTNLTESRAKDSVAGDVSGRSVAMRLNGLGGTKLLNWVASLSDQRTQARGSRDVQQLSTTATLLITPDIEWNVGLTAGRERNDYTTLSRESSTTYGANANWTPTPRTKLLADWMRHSYGDSHTLSLEHRMARTVWRLSDSQSVNTGGPQGNAGAMTNYDLYFLQYAGLVPDPRERDVFVRALLVRLGLPPGSLINSGFLSAAPTLLRSRSFSFSWQGLRTSVTAMLTQSKSRRIDVQGPAVDDLSQSALVQQRGLSLSLAHQLTPTDSASLVFSQQQSLGDQRSQGTDLKSLTANWNGRFGARLSWQLGLRHSRFESTQQPYRESAVIATLVQQF
ncbi:TIGR03016 family PEP-CTERM system-associated outer membrane protein [Paucibacter sp. XJ19-41]|nr:TIGR03016 family PEP-CTERM system-associated outer membrane protein [Paucibacter sp. XJ19-41]